MCTFNMHPLSTSSSWLSLPRARDIGGYEEERRRGQWMLALSST